MNELDALRAKVDELQGSLLASECFLNALTEALSPEQRQVVSAFYASESAAFRAALMRSTAPEAAPWQPVARFLASRYAEQRRMEEQIERQSQQARDNQRKLEQLNEKLEALKAIERSLTTRPPAGGAASAPAPKGNSP